MLAIVTTAAPVVHAVVPVVVTHVSEVHHAFGAVDHLRQVGPTLLAFLTGAGGSLLFSLLKKDKWSSALNNTIVFVYAALIALLDAFLKGQLTLNGGLTIFLLVYGSALSWYNLHKLVYTSTLPVVTNP